MTTAVACQIYTTAFGLMMEVATCGDGSHHRCAWIDALEKVLPFLASGGLSLAISLAPKHNNG